MTRFAAEPPELEKPLDVPVNQAHVAFVANVWNSQYPEYARASALRRGCTEEEIRLGVAQWRAQLNEHENWRRIYGSPEYGGWTRSNVDGRQKPRDIVEAEDAEARQHNS